ncbi:hypothetical protein [Kitasatospora sp. NPDC088346]|uniref:hypothetical protein n=1 Tax=Kitasatospora sp. NPDC088346 TaxID=3364073 RepID=UPI003804A799
MPDRQQPEIARRRGTPADQRRVEPEHPVHGWSADLRLAESPSTSDDFRVPRAWLRSVPTGTIILSTSTLASALSHGSLPTDSPLLWPLVALTVASMGYDLGLRALRQRQKQ